MLLTCVLVFGSESLNFVNALEKVCGHFQGQCMLPIAQLMRRNNIVCVQQIAILASRIIYLFEYL